MYAVVGATGNTGRAVVKELKGLGENPVCIVRNADKAKEVLGADTKTAVAELDDRAGLQKALAGAKRVFIVTGHNPKSDEQQINVIEAAKAAGAEYIVKVSGGRDVIGPNVESVNGQAHYKIEEHLKKSGLQVVHPQPRPVHAEHHGAGGQRSRTTARSCSRGRRICPWR